MDVKKWIYCPLWRCEKLEKKLSEMEATGFRLIEVRSRIWYPVFCNQYRFKSSKPKSVDYFAAYFIGKEPMSWVLRSGKCQSILLTEHAADEIPMKGYGGSYSIFRIAGENRDFAKAQRMRAYYSKHVLAQFVIFAFFLLGMFLFCSIATVLQGRSLPVILIVLSALTLVSSVYFLYGYIIQMKKYKALGCTKQDFADCSWRDTEK